MIGAFAQTITLVTRTASGEDSMGNDEYTTTETTVKGVFSPGGSAEVAYGNNDQVTTQPTVYLPAGTSLTAIDQVQVNGTSYEVDGDPLAWGPSPFTNRPGVVQVPLRKVTG